MIEYLPYLKILIPNKVLSVQKQTPVLVKELPSIPDYPNIPKKQNLGTRIFIVVLFVMIILSISFQFKVSILLFLLLPFFISILFFINDLYQNKLSKIKYLNAINFYESELNRYRNTVIYNYKIKNADKNAEFIRNYRIQNLKKISYKYLNTNYEEHKKPVLILKQFETVFKKKFPDESISLMVPTQYPLADFIIKHNLTKIEIVVFVNNDFCINESTLFKNHLNKNRIVLNIDFELLYLHQELVCKYISHVFAKYCFDTKYNILLSNKNDSKQEYNIAI